MLRSIGHLNNSLLERPGAASVPCCSMIRRSCSLFSMLAILTASGTTTLSTGIWVYCVGSQGHAAIEPLSASCALGDSPTSMSEPSPCPPEKCGSCTDYPASFGADSAPARSEAVSLVPPAISPVTVTLYSPPAHPVLTIEATRFLSSSHVASQTPLRC